ncbi:glycosyltransferase [Pantoea septica]|uniref:glycosyltransferase n=1 Tax=Pantoea septica TaxID=472695 RepID=UPI0009071552|nr:glycosyltransferase [Pantoea septica]
MPKIAIITRTKNRNQFLSRAIESVISQTYKDWVHVIVNDGGDEKELDETVKPYLSEYSNRLKIIHKPYSSGMEAATNTGIKNSDSQWLAIHDDDDTWDKDFLKLMLNHIETHKLDGCVCHVKQIFETEKNGLINITSCRYFNPDLKKIRVKDIRSNNLFMPISFVFSREICKEIGGFDESFLVCGDWDFHYRYLNHANVGLISLPLANYHIRKMSQSSVESMNSIHKKDLHNNYKRKFILKHKITKTDLWCGLIREFVLFKPTRYFLRKVK